MPISAITGTDTQYPVMINGYLCYSAGDVRSARQFTDPNKTEPNKTERAPKAAASTPAATSPLQSQRSPLHSYTVQGTARDDDWSQPSRSRGSRIDIWA
jgi:hypothetical protein